MEMMHAELIDWSRAQFALRGLYHFLFVPLMLGPLVLYVGYKFTVFNISHFKKLEKLLEDE